LSVDIAAVKDRGAILVLTCASHNHTAAVLHSLRSYSTMQLRAWKQHSLDRVAISSGSAMNMAGASATLAA